MVLIAENLADSDYDLSSTILEYGTQYFWRVDSANEFGVALGDVWSFTSLVFAPPADMVTTKRLVVAANNTIFYEDE